MKSATRTRVFTEPADVHAARHAVRHGTATSTPDYIAEVADGVHESAASMGKDWHAVEYNFAATCGPLTEAVSLVLDTYVDAENSSAGMVLSGWTDYYPTSVVAATNEETVETARVIMADMDLYEPGENPELWGSEPRFVPGEDMHADVLISRHRHVERRVRAHPNIEQARIMGSFEHAGTRALRAATQTTDLQIGLHARIMHLTTQQNS